MKRPTARKRAAAGWIWGLILFPLTTQAAAGSPTTGQLTLLLGITLVCVLALAIVLIRRNAQLARLRRALDAALTDDNLILSNLSEMVWLKDPNGIYLACNPALAAFYGRQPHDVVGRSDFDLMDTAEARGYRKADRAAVEAGENCQERGWQTFTENNRTVYTLIDRTPIYDDDGRLIGVLGVARDITELHSAETALEQRNSYLRALIDNFPFKVWLKDTDSRFRIVNQRYAETVGCATPAELVNRTDLDCWPEDIARSNRDEDARVLSTRRKIERNESVEIDGEPRYLEVYKAPVINDLGQAIGTVGYSRDITERHMLAQNLKESEQRFRNFFDQHSVPMLFIEPESGRIIEMNPAAISFYGYPREQLQDLCIDRLYTITPEEVTRKLERIKSGEETHFEAEHQLADGSLRDVDVYSVSVTTEGRALLLSLVIDITEQKSTQGALKRERDLFSAGPVLVVSWIPAEGWPVAQVSANVVDVLGYTRDEIEQEDFRFAGLVHPEDLARINEEVERYQAKGITKFEQSYRIRVKDGSYRWFLDFTQLEQDGQGRLTAIRGYLFDQTRTKELEISLSDERRRLQSIIAGTRVGTWEWNVQNGETRFNECWAQIIGYSLDELAPVSISTWMQFTHPDDLESSNAILKQHFDGKREFYEFEARMRHKNGEWIWVLDRGQVFEWTDAGEPLWMAGTHQDITARKRGEQAVAESERRLRSAGESAFDLIYEWNSIDDQLEWFGDIDKALGCPAGTIDNDLATWLSRIHPDDRDNLTEAVEKHRSSLEPYEYLYRVRHDNGDYRWWQDKASPVTDSHGRSTRWVGACTDVTHQRHAEEKRRLAATVFAHAQEGIMIADAQANIMDVNEAFSSITGYQRNEVLGKNPRFLSSGRQDAGFYRQMWGNLLEHGHWTGEVWNRRKDGCAYAENLSISAVYDNHGEVQNFVALFSDITLQKENQHRLEHIAYFDPLTGLPNRILLGDRLLRAMARTERQDQMLAVVYLDLDGFKAVNDEFGHDVGDQMLIDLAGRLKQVLREEDTVSRLGGDEFVAVLVDLDQVSNCVELLPRMLGAAAQPIHHGDTEITLSASLGVTFYPQPESVDSDQLLRQADQAMYQAKLAGKNRYHIFDAEQDRSIRGKVERLEEIRQALDNDRFALHYQPKVNMRSGRIIGAEALIRWPQDDGGMLMPGDFLPTLENHSLAIVLDEWVFDRALTQLEKWHHAGLKISISVNVSAHHLQQSDFIEHLQAMLSRHPQADPGYLVVEILESTALMDLKRISGVIRAGQALGVIFALDDFGTGYSSLSYLKSLPAKQLKIDRSFVRDMLDDRDDLAILEGVMGLAAAFDRQPIAEGVESVEHGEILLQLGCEIAQGFGIGRPMPAERLETWASTWRPDPVWQHQGQIGREDLPLVFAMVEHRSWVKAIADRIKGERTCTPPMDERHCNFAQWISEHGEQRYGNQAAFQEVNRLHQQVHRLAPELLHLHAGGDTVAAMDQLQELYRLRDLLLEQMKLILHQTSQRQTGTY